MLMLGVPLAFEMGPPDPDPLVLCAVDPLGGGRSLGVVKFKFGGRGFADGLKDRVGALILTILDMSLRII